MTIINFTPLPALMGGLIIGLAATLLFLLRGRIFGISGFLGGLVSLSRGDILWRVLSASGLIIGAYIVHLIMNTPQVLETVSTERLVVSGLLVGFGTRLGSGCTSGHGVCGLSRLSARSLVATLCFMCAGFITVYLFPHS